MKAKNVAIYIRVSTHHQIDKDSLPFQRRELTNYAKYVLNCEDYTIFEDAGYSAKNTDRPAYQDMMSRIRAGEFTHLLVWKLDRISRNLRDFTGMWDELKEYGVTFVSKMEQFDTSSAMGEAMLRIILVFAELERKLTAERVMSIMLSRAKKGEWNGSPVAIGYDWDYEKKQVKVNDEEAAIVQKVFDLYEKLGSSKLVANWLEKHGVKTKRGGEWISSSVIKVLRNPVYVGTYRWNYREGSGGTKKDPEEVIMVEDAIPAIIDEEQWERVQKLIDSNRNGIQSNRKKYTHILTGILKCGYCGKNYSGTRATRPHANGLHPTYYRCVRYSYNRSCQNKGVSGLQVEPFIFEYLRALVKAKDSSDVLKEFDHPEVEYIDIPGPTGVYRGVDVLAAPQVAAATEEDKVDLLKARKKKIETAIARLDDAYYFAEGHNAITKSEYLVKRADFQQKLNQVDAEIAAASEKAPATKRMDIENFSRFLLLHDLYLAGDIKEVLYNLDKKVLRDFIEGVIKYVEVADQRITKIAFFSPDGEGEVVHRFVYKENP